jgi:hypothetical protein
MLQGDTAVPAQRGAQTTTLEGPRIPWRMEIWPVLKKVLPEPGGPLLQNRLGLRLRHRLGRLVLAVEHAEIKGVPPKWPRLRLLGFPKCRRCRGEDISGDVTSNHLLPSRKPQYSTTLSFR